MSSISQTLQVATLWVIMSSYYLTSQPKSKVMEALDTARSLNILCSLYSLHTHSRCEKTEGNPVHHGVATSTQQTCLTSKIQAKMWGNP